MPFLVMRHDLRAPAFGSASYEEIVKASLEQYRWADAHGFDMLSVTEHHGVDDGWDPAPLTTAAMVLASTERAPVLVSALILPLHDPVRVAEQIALLDNAAPGRLLTVLGAGYRPEEFAMAGVDFARRGRVLEEYVGVLRRAWTGEPFEWQGRSITVTPAPASRPHPMIAIGGGTEVAARRAARLGLPLFPQLADPRLDGWYAEEAEKTGVGGGYVMQPGGPTFVWATRDPDRTWNEIGEHVLYEATTYAAWQTHGAASANQIDADDVEGVRRAPNVLVGTPDELVSAWNDLGDTGAFVLQPLAGGIPPEVAWEGLELFAADVLPRLRTSRESVELG